MNLDEMTEDQIQAEATKHGYNPNYEGENKKSPKEFLEVAYNHNHVLKERNDKLSKQIEDLTLQAKKQQELTKKLVDDIDTQKKKAVDKALKELKAERRDAITEGNVERVEQIDKEIQEQQEVAKIDGNPILDAWMEKNPWYLNDRDMGLEADVITKTLEGTGRFPATEQGLKDLLSEVDKRIKKAFPEKFTNPKKDELPEVDGGRPSPSKKSKKTYEDLPADAKAACDEFVQAGIFKKREDYVAIYEWE